MEGTTISLTCKGDLCAAASAEPGAWFKNTDWKKGKEEGGHEGKREGRTEEGRTHCFSHPRAMQKHLTRLVRCRLFKKKRRRGFEEEREGSAKERAVA